MPHVITETVENNEFLKRFKNFYTEQDIDVAIDNENPHLFHEDILKEANLFL